MDGNPFRCKNCGHIPRSPPHSGSWYCPKCGKRMTISAPQSSRPRRIPPKSVKRARKSRDQVTRQIYQSFTYEKSPNLGFKEPYINPNIHPIAPKKRNKIRIFTKK